MKTHVKTTGKEAFQTVDDTTRTTRLETVPLRPPGGQKDKHKAPHCDVEIAGMAPVLTHERIAERARAIWVERGCMPNEDDRNWHEAEAQLRHELGLEHPNL